MTRDSITATELTSQWRNPGDIFSLLLLVGGDVIQKAIARQVGVQVLGIHFNPVAFSFGWVAYGFMSLASVLGNQKLMPGTKFPLKVINCESGYDRDNQSWVISCLFEHYENREAQQSKQQSGPPRDSTGSVSLAIEIFVAKASKGPKPGLFWFLCLLVILVQQGLGVAVWVHSGEWSIFMITATGTILSVISASWPQWVKEKWPSKRLTRDGVKPIALTRGNGHQYVLLILCHQESWDLEAMASARSQNVPGTRLVFGILALFWTLLLITVTGIQDNSWFLMGIGFLGMLQNVLAAAMPCSPSDLDIELTPWEERASVVGYQYNRDVKKDLKADRWKSYTMEDAREEYEKKMGAQEVRDTMGALIELEKYLPRAGLSLLPAFFPGGKEGFRIEREKVFWQFAEEQL